jgi:CelD/BcsL family acetyltransferase involved in cellulose biosynthesis
VLESGLSSVLDESIRPSAIDIGSAIHLPAAQQRSLSSRVTAAEVISWSEVDSALRNRFVTLRATQQDFKTPFFSLGFLDCVHAARGDVDVIVMEDGDQVVGMLPIHRLGRVAVPAGRFLNDAHNVIADSQTQLDWLWTLDRCNLKSFDFHALVGSRYGMRETSILGNTQSFSADLGTSSVKFLQALESDHGTIRRQEQKTRKMQREIGPVTLELDCRDPALLEQAIQWKSNQYQRTNILDLFKPHWTRTLMYLMHEKPPVQMAVTPTRGVLSVLRAGEEVVAMHYGMVESGLLHYWFPAYDPKFACYSPGTALFKSIVRASTDAGIHCIDMGYGEQPYKRKQTDTITLVSHGCVSTSGRYRTWRRAVHAATKLVKQVPMKESIKHLVRRVHPQAGMSKLD